MGALQTIRAALLTAAATPNASGDYQLNFSGSGQVYYRVPPPEGAPRSLPTFWLYGLVADSSFDSNLGWRRRVYTWQWEAHVPVSTDTPEARATEAEKALEDQIRALEALIDGALAGTAYEVIVKGAVLEGLEAERPGWGVVAGTIQVTREAQTGET